MVPFEEIMVLVGRVMVSWRHQQGSSRGHNTRWESCTAAAADGRRSTWRNWLLAPSQHSANVMRWSRPADAWRAGAATRDLARALQRRACRRGLAQCAVARCGVVFASMGTASCALPCITLGDWCAGGTRALQCTGQQRHDGPSDQSRNNGSPGRTKSSETRLEASEDNFS
jgi:hypothetical protein